MTALPRADCPICDREVALRVNGTLREHRFHGRTLCSASGLTPAEAAAHATELAGEAMEPELMARELGDR